MVSTRFTHSKRTVSAAAALALLIAMRQAPRLVADDGATSPPAAASPATPKLQSLEVEPPRVLLRGASRRQQMLVTGITADGRKLDVTHLCRFEIADGRVARIEGGVVEGGVIGSCIVEGIAEGRTTLRVVLGAMASDVALTVEQFNTYPPVDFASDVMPIFTKGGCNSGGCHGKAGGQNGFKLSIFGFDPRADYNAIVKEARGRRVFPASPRRSLLLTKSMGVIPHGGGRRIAAGSREHEILDHWLHQGMPWSAEGAPRVTGIEVRPAERRMGLKARQQLQVTARFSDGSRRDVTAWTVFSSNAPQVAEVDERGVARTGEYPGESAVTASFLGQVTVARIQVPRPGSPGPYPKLSGDNPIDALVWAKLKKMGILPSPDADDATFLRRASLDTLGVLPTPREARAFLADQRPDKRTRLIDALLEREEFADYWALKWSDILLVDRDKLGERGAFVFHRWLRDQVAANRPYDQWTRELITATGNSGKNGPVNFYRALRTPEELAQSVSQAFLGIRVECAQCHHHPWERWGREDFFGLASFFSGIERRTARGGREVVYHAGYRPMKIPFTDQTIAAKPLGGETPDDLDRGDPRAPLARWITSPENPWFARLAGNRLWKHFLGRGLVEPEDDLRSTNPPTNAPLLDYLESQVVESGFDLKAVMRRILTSRVYALSSVPNETNYGDEQNYSHYYVKRLPAEVLLDAVNTSCGVSESFAGRPPGTKAVQLWDNHLPSYFLEIFGRPERTSPCECVRSSEPTMAQALHLMNAPEIEAKLADPRGRVALLNRSGVDRARLVEELCLASLGRFPDEKERRIAARLFAEAPPAEAAEDFLWTLLNSYDFLFNH